MANNPKKPKAQKIEAVCADTKTPLQFNGKPLKIQK